MSSASHFILYVADQQRSAAFYRAVLRDEARLDVPGMTEFALPGGGVLGLMPEAGIRKLLGGTWSIPLQRHDAPRAELYLVVDDPVVFHARAIAQGARELSPLAPRTWGHDAAYALDLDGYVLAFARESTAG